MKRAIFTMLAALSCVSTVAWADPVKLGGSAFGSTCGTAGVGVTIVSAATNTAGLTITSGNLTGGSNGEQTLLEAVYPDGTAHVIWLINSSTFSSTVIPYPIFIPAGVALVCVPSQTNNGGAFVTYNLYSN